MLPATRLLTRYNTHHLNTQIHQLIINALFIHIVTVGERRRFQSVFVLLSIILLLFCFLQGLHLKGVELRNIAASKMSLLIS